MPEDCLESLPDLTLLVKGLREREINQQTGKIKKGAFIPRRNGNDDDGLSVSQPCSDSLQELKMRLQNKDGLFCQLVVGSVRLIEEQKIKLDVWPDPTESDHYHSLIKGVPVSLAEAAVANRLAGKLAEVSSLYAPRP